MPIDPKPVADDALAAGWNALRNGRTSAAERTFQALIEAGRDDAGVWHGLGLAALQSHRHDAAATYLERAVRRAPDASAIHANLGTAYRNGGRFGEAIAAFRAALALDPHRIGASNNLALTYHQTGDLDRAVETLETAVERDPCQPALWVNLGRFYKEQGRASHAIDAFSQAVDIRPDRASAFAELFALAQRHPAHAPEPLPMLNRRYFLLHTRSLRQSYVPPAELADARKRSVLGYLVPGEGAAIDSLLRPVWLAHDRRRYDMVVYWRTRPLGLEDGKYPGATHRDVEAIADDGVAALVRDDGIDVLVGVTTDDPLLWQGVLAARPARLNGLWPISLGWTGVTGADFVIAAFAPDTNDHGVAPQVIKVEPGRPWNPSRTNGHATALPATGRGFVTFAALQPAHCICEKTIALWKGVLREVPGAVLHVVGVPPGLATRRIERQLGEHAPRVVFQPASDAAVTDELAASTDIAIDPVCGGPVETSLEWLGGGVPILALSPAPGRDSVTRRLLDRAGLGDWHTPDAEAACAQARRFAADIVALEDLRKRLPESIRSAFAHDARRHVATLERELDRMFAAACVAPPLVDNGTTWSEPPLTQHVADATARHGQRLAAEGRLDEGIRLMQRCMRFQPNGSWLFHQYVAAIRAWSARNPAASGEPFPAPDARPGDRRLVSVIICSIDADKFARSSTDYRRLLGDHPHEIIGVHDARSLCEGYNRGASRARGDILVFSHDDIAIPTPRFAARLLDHLAHADGVGVAGSTRLAGTIWSDAGAPWACGNIVHRDTGTGALSYLPIGLPSRCVHRCQVLDGVFIAVSRHVWEAIRFDQDTFDGWHLYDIDFSWRACAAGFDLAVALDLLLIHEAKAGPAAGWDAYSRRFAEKFPQFRRSAIAPHVLPTLPVESLHDVSELARGFAHFRFGWWPDGDAPLPPLLSARDARCRPP